MPETTLGGTPSRPINSLPWGGREWSCSAGRSDCLVTFAIKEVEASRLDPDLGEAECQVITVLVQPAHVFSSGE